MSERFHIGKLARETGHSTHTIRWYENQGLIPGIVRDEGGRRVYQEDHIEWLNYLHFLSKTGMSIKEMRGYTELVVKGWRSLPQRKALLEKHKEKVLEDIKRLEVALKLIDLKVEFYTKWQADKKRPKNAPTVSSVED